MSRQTRHERFLATRWFPRPGGRLVPTRAYPPYRRRLRFEPLEDRRLLAVMSVTALSDDTLANLEGDGLLSLREAVSAINTGAAVDGIGPISGVFGVDDQIVFDASLFAGGPQTLLLSAGELSLTRAFTITGPGAAILTIDAQQQSRIFRIAQIGSGSGGASGDDGGASGATLIDVISGLTLTGGQTNLGGGAIDAMTARVTIVDSVITGNMAGDDGGGIKFRGGELTIIDSTISNNISSGPDAQGGGLFAETSAVSISGSAISDNHVLGASAHGGGVYFSDPFMSGPQALEIVGSTISGNTAEGGGGGIYVADTSFTVTGSTISDNESAAAGGGIHATGDLTLSGSTVTGNSTTADQADGGGIYAQGDVTLTQTTVSANSTTGFRARGGGIYSAEDVTMTGSTVSGNSTAGDSAPGGGAAAFGNVTLTGSVVTGNRTTGNESGGGGIAAGFNATLDQSTVSDNSTLGNLSSGGGIIAFNDATLTDSIVSGNSSAGHTAQGGGIDAFRYASLVRSTVSDNRTTGYRGSGGGIRANGATLTDSVVSGNSTAGVYGRGGGVYAGGGDVTLTRSTISDNHTTGDVAPGGGVSVTSGDLTLIESTVSGNSTSGFDSDGGGIRVFAASSPVSITQSTISGNSTAGADAEGGGIRVAGSAILTQSTVSNNSTAGFRARGGGIANVGMYAVLTFNESTISSNSTLGYDAEGGGIYAAGPLTISESTISGNSTAGESAYGGGIRAAGGATITSSTIVDNHALALYALGGGIVGDNPFQIRGAIIAGNTAGRGNSELLSFTSLLEIDFSLIGDTSDLGASELIDIMTGTGNLADVDPLLGPLADNGGPTMTRALLVGSPAIDAGDPAAVAGEGGVPLYDQRGAPFGRVSRGRIDVGAYEAHLVVDTLVDENDGDHAPGDLSLREALGLASANPNPDTITFDPALFAGGPGTISLMLGELPVNTSLTIAGPGANSLTIDAAGSSRVLLVDDLNNANLLDVTISGLTLTGGQALGGDGGGIHSRENLTVADSVISGSQSNRGGGIFHRNGELAVRRSTVSGNMALRGTVGSGGGIFIYSGNTAILSSTVSGNSATYGGGLYVRTPLTDTTLVSNSTISGNQASIGGGGVYNFLGHTLIEFSTITNNSAPVGRGGGVVTWPFPNSTLTELRSSIVAGNVGSDLFHTSGGTNTFASLGYNLVGTGEGTAAFVGPGDLVGVTNPGLGPLAENDGPTWTHALLVGSPAIDAGDPAAVAGMGDVPEFDQRGEPFGRVMDGDGASGAQIDIGAFELQPPVGPPLLGDYNQNGIVDAADYTTWRDTLGQTGLVIYSGADGSGDGVIGPEDYQVWKSHFGQTLPMPGAGSTEQRAGSTESLASAATPTTADPAPVPQSATRHDAPAVLRPTARQDAAAVLRPTARQNAAAVAAHRDAALLAWVAAFGNAKRQRFDHAIESRDNGAVDRESDDVLLDGVDAVFQLVGGG